MISAGELLGRKKTDYPILLEGLLPKVGLAALGGSSDTGKSSLLRDLALHVAEGKETFLGQKLYLTHKSAIYVSTEDDEDSVAYLLYKQLKEADPASFNSLIYEFETINLLSKLTDTLEHNPVDLIIIDAYTDVFTGDINSSVSVRNFLNQYRELANKFECLILFLHHFGKNRNEEFGSKHSFLGSKGFEAKMRVALSLSKDSSDTSIRKLEILKGNYLSAEDKESYFKLKFLDNMRFECLGRSKSVSSSHSEKEKEKKMVISTLHRLVKQGKTWEQITATINSCELKFKPYSKSTLNAWYLNSVKPN